MAETDTPDVKGPSDRPDFDALLQDLFGLNVRGLKTLGDLVVRPKTVFESARISDWRSKYTPTMRLAFSILTVFTLLSFFWAAEDGALYQSLLVQIEPQLADSPNAARADEIVKATFAGYSFMYPFVYMLFHTMVGSLVFFWGKGTPWVARVRLYFGVLSIGLGLAVASISIMPLIDPSNVNTFTFVGTLVGYLVYGLTYARGMAGSLSKLKLWVRAFFIGLIVTITDVLVALTASVGGGVWAAYQAGL